MTLFLLPGVGLTTYDTKHHGLSAGTKMAIAKSGQKLVEMVKLLDGHPSIGFWTL